MKPSSGTPNSAAENVSASGPSALPDASQTFMSENRQARVCRMFSHAPARSSIPIDPGAIEDTRRPTSSAISNSGRGPASTTLMRNRSVRANSAAAARPTMPAPTITMSNCLFIPEEHHVTVAAIFRQVPSCALRKVGVHRVPGRNRACQDSGSVGRRPGCHRTGGRHHR